MSSAVFFFFFSFSRWRLNVAVSIQGRNPSLPALNLPPPRPVAGGQVGLESKVGVAVGSRDRRRLTIGSRNKKKNSVVTVGCGGKLRVKSDAESSCFVSSELPLLLLLHAPSLARRQLLIEGPLVIIGSNS